MLRVLFLPSTRVLGVEIQGQVIGADIDHVLIEMDRRVREFSKFRMLVDVIPQPLAASRFNRRLRLLLRLGRGADVSRRISPALLTTLKLTMTHRKHLERCAVVSDSKRLGRFVWIINACFRRMDVRCFPRVSRDLAVHWLSANDRALVPVRTSATTFHEGVASGSPGQGASLRNIPELFRSSQKERGIF